MFEFHDPGRLIDDGLELVLRERYPDDPILNYVPAYKFDMRLAGQDKAAYDTRTLRQAQDAAQGTGVIGHIDLRIGNTTSLIMYGGHIGYGVVPKHRGQRYAARACRLLFPLARGHGLETLWITCNPDNIASRRTCELAGGKLVEIVDLPEASDMYQAGERQKCRYRFDL